MGAVGLARESAWVRSVGSVGTQAETPHCSLFTSSVVDVKVVDFRAMVQSIVFWRAISKFSKKKNDAQHQRAAGLPPGLKPVSIEDRVHRPEGRCFHPDSKVPQG